MNMTKHENALINFVKALPFEALLDAGNGIEKAVEEANATAHKLEAEGNPNAVLFKARAKELQQLDELLGNANADYRHHIHPEEEQTASGTGITQMLKSDAGEAIHLFKIMKKYGVTCSLEMKVTNSLDPLMGIVKAAVNVDYFAGSEGDAVIIELDGTSLSFELHNHSFSKYVSDCQIEVCIYENSGAYSAFFSSGAVRPEGIAEANSYEA